MKDIAFGIVVFPLSWRFGLWRREKKDIFSVGPIRFVLYKQPGRWKPSEALIQRPSLTISVDETSHVITDGLVVVNDIYSCSCHRKMGNDFFFLPIGECLRPDKRCDRPVRK